MWLLNLSSCSAQRGTQPSPTSVCLAKHAWFPLSGQYFRYGKRNTRNHRRVTFSGQLDCYCLSARLSTSSQAPFLFPWGVTIQFFFREWFKSGETNSVPHRPTRGQRNVTWSATTRPRLGGKRNDESEASCYGESPNLVLLRAGSTRLRRLTTVKSGGPKSEQLFGGGPRGERNGFKVALRRRRNLREDFRTARSSGLRKLFCPATTTWFLFWEEDCVVLLAGWWGLPWSSSRGTCFRSLRVEEFAMFFRCYKEILWTWLRF